MALISKDGGLTVSEKRIVKKLLEMNWRNQDIQALINLGRKATVNSARVTGVKRDPKQSACTDAEVDRFIRIKHSYDPKTGLNPHYDERLIRAREAMLLAVTAYNNPTLAFKSELFAVLSNIAWTYLLHEYFLRKKTPIANKDGFTVALSEMIAWADCPLSSGMKINLKDVNKLRDKVEHSLLERSDGLWSSLFQANCLNFDKAICEMFGARLTLQGALSFSLQFAKANLEQLKEIGKYDIPTDIAALNKEMLDEKTDEQRNDLEYQFSVIYTIVPSSKATAHFQFVSPESSEGQDISNILVRYRPADDLYPFKAGVVAKEVGKAIARKFSISDHTRAWQAHKIRPSGNIVTPDKVNTKYCHYHKAHKDFTYNQAWLDLLISENLEIQVGQA
jgi:Protein of unknown function (DUF3644)